MHAQTLLRTKDCCTYLFLPVRDVIVEDSHENHIKEEYTLELLSSEFQGIAVAVEYGTM
jgi:hypothetical protein